MFVNYVIVDRRSDGGDSGSWSCWSSETKTVEAAIRAFARPAEGAVTVWRRQQQGDPRVVGFVGIPSSLEIVALFARAGTDDHEAALWTSVCRLVVPNSSLLKEADLGTRNSNGEPLDYFSKTL